MSSLVSESLRRRLRSGDLVLHVREIAGANHDENRPLIYGKNQLSPSHVKHKNLQCGFEILRFARLNSANPLYMLEFRRVVPTSGLATIRE
jgi:hypothetical protein